MNRRKTAEGQPRSNTSVRREDVRDAALTLFAERGYHGTTMRDIAEVLGLRAPSLYNHLESKQSLLQEIMFGTMETLLSEYEAVIATTDDVTEQLRRAMEAHVRYHARYRREVRIGNSEIQSLEEPARTRIRQLRRRYAHSWIALIERGVEEGRFETPSPRLAAYGMLEMGIGVSLWFRSDGLLSESQLAYFYADMALRLVGKVAVAHPLVESGVGPTPLGPGDRRASP